MDFSFSNNFSHSELPSHSSFTKGKRKDESDSELLEGTNFFIQRDLCNNLDV